MASQRARCLSTAANPRGMDCHPHRDNGILTSEEQPPPNSEQQPRTPPQFAIANTKLPPEAAGINEAQLATPTKIN